ncbi:MAG TPA: CDP-alcohol phosphatidyltransferase family protein [Vicinamibacterales bacterium]|nr:CDP-alcohol phosphatidyltransferase family protein [Vicinamibacterales bacterium]
MEDTEELVDFYIHRPLARPIARALMPTSITPNAVTIAGGALGVSAGAALWFSGDAPWLRLAAAGLLFGSVVFDCVDGQLARLRNQASRAGVILDGLVDIAVGVATIGAAAHVLSREYPAWSMWALCAAAMVSSEAQCLLFDIAKERYVTAQRITYVPGKLRMSGQSPAEESRESAILVGMFDRYATAVAALAAASGRITRAQMQAWATIGLGTHFALLYTAVAISYAWLPALYGCLMIYTTAMNVVLMALLWMRPLRFSTSS